MRPGISCVCLWHGILVRPAWLVSRVRPHYGHRLYVTLTLQPSYPALQSLNPLMFTVDSKTNTNRVPTSLATKPCAQRSRSLQCPQRRLVSRHPRADPHLLHQRHTLQLRTCDEAHYDSVCEGGGSCDGVPSYHDGDWRVPALQDAESLQYEHEHWSVGKCVVDVDRIVYTGDVAE